MSEYEREIELYDYIEVLLRYKWFILAATLVCGALGWYFRPAPPPPLYEADAVVEVLGVPSATDGQQGASGGSVSASGASYSTLALSDEMKRALIDSLKLPMSIAGLDGVLKVEAGSPGLRFSVQVHDSSLPIPILNAWLQLFAESNRVVNLEDNRIAVQHLVLAKDIDALEFQRSRLESLLDSMSVERYQFELEMRNIEYEVEWSMLRNVDPALSKRGLLAEFDKHFNYQLVDRLFVASGIDSLLTLLGTFNEELRKFEEGNKREALGAEPNPIYLGIEKTLFETRLKYDERKRQLMAGGGEALGDSFPDWESVFLAVEKRSGVIRWFELRSALQQVESAIQAASAQRDQVVETMRERLRLVDDGRSASISFSELLKRAVASRQRATDDIRVLSRALEVRTVPQEGGQNKTAIAAGAGLLLSAILSLLIEYVRKARALRQSGAVQD